MSDNHLQDIPIPPALANDGFAQQHFRNIVAIARQHPFYQHRLADLSCGVPLLQRTDIVENNELFLNGNPANGITSGSTSMPVKLCWGKPRSEIEARDNQQFAWWMGGPLKRVSIVSTTRHKQDENTLEVNTPLPEQVEFILHKGQQGFEALLSYPSNMLMLCEYILEKGIDMSFIKRVVCMSEVYEAHHDAAIQKAFSNARTWSNYSSTEVGATSFQCPHNKNMHHVMAHKLGVEILDEHNKPCQTGQLGRIVITDYFNRKTPFIRYDIGDLAAPAQCTCNEIKLPAIQNIVGKVRGTLKKRDGSRVIFTDLSVAMRDLPYNKQYQVIQESLEVFTVRMVKKLPVENAHIEQELGNIFFEQFGYHPKIILQEETVIEKDKNGKFYASICKA